MARFANDSNCQIEAAFIGLPHEGIGNLTNWVRIRTLRQLRKG